MKIIDLNCDLGEGMKNDAQIMSYISSCNIACGGHYGDEQSVATALQLALKYGVKAGAHPSFEDRSNFGRVFMDVSRSRFRESITQQLHIFKKTALKIGVKIHHIKMHGALYHATAYREDFSDWLVELIADLYPKTILYVPAKSILEQKCIDHKISYMRESFGDRSYDASGKLVARTEKNALIIDYKNAANQIIQLVDKQSVSTIQGTPLSLETDTICIHGDNIELVKDLKLLIQELLKKGIKVG